MSGFIKIHRSIVDWEWSNSPKHLAVFLHLITHANYKQTKWRGKIIEPGQLLTGRKQISEWTGVSERGVRTVLKDLKTTSEVTIKSFSKYSIITITNWEKYQLPNAQTTNNSPSKRPASDHIQEGKEVYKNNNSVFPHSVITELNSVLGTNYRHSTKSTLTLIQARAREGFREISEYRRVFEYKNQQWCGTDMEKYLRPQTLLGTKFESYLVEANKHFGKIEEKKTRANDYVKKIGEERDNQRVFFSPIRKTD